jgi:hypothetical protein
MSILDRYNNTSNKPETLAERIVFRVMDELNGRSGFDHWWSNIDADIQNEILNDLHQTVERELNKKGQPHEQ